MENHVEHQVLLWFSLLVCRMESSATAITLIHLLAESLMWFSLHTQKKISICRKKKEDGQHMSFSTRAALLWPGL